MKDKIEISHKIKETFFLFLNNLISINDLENFIYENLEQIERIFKRSDYFEIIDFNFHENDSNYKITELILKYIDISEFETWRLKEILNSIIDKKVSIIDPLITLYKEYCKGYYFLKELGIDHGLDLIIIDDISESDKKLEIEYPIIRQKAKHILDCLTNGAIIITDEYEFTYKNE